MNNLGVWKRLALLALLLMLIVWMAMYGMVMFADRYVISALFSGAALLTFWHGHVVNSGHVMPYEKLQAEDLSAAAIYLGEDEWQELSDNNTEQLVKLLNKLDYYKDWHESTDNERYAGIPLDDPEWHFRLTSPNGAQTRISVGNSFTTPIRRGRKQTLSGAGITYLTMGQGPRALAIAPL